MAKVLIGNLKTPPEFITETELDEILGPLVATEVANAMVNAPALGISAHVNSPTPHPAYDDLPSFTLIFENGLV